MPYDKESVIVSERAYQVLQKLQGGDGSYGSKIAKELDTTQQVVSEIISNLEEHDIVEKGKRTQAQFYVVNWDIFPELVHDLLEEKYGEKDGQLDVLKEAWKSAMGSEEKSDQVEDFIQAYVRKYLENVENSTVLKMLTEDYFSGLNRYLSITPEEDLPKWLFDHFQEIRVYFSSTEDPYSIVREAVEETEG